MDKFQKIWMDYAKKKDPGLKGQLILEYSYLVKYVAGRLSMHLGQYVDYEDLISYGIFGLIDAIEKFDLGKGFKFETYASLRIRGAILDNIRKLDWVPRTLRQKNKLLEGAYSQLEAALGREPTDEELAEKLEMPLKEAQELIRKSSLVSLVSLDDYLEQNHEGTNLQTEAEVQTPESAYEMKELKEILAKTIETLPEKEQKVVMLYYFEELTLKEISKIMGVTESRISQIHSKAVLRMKTKLGKYKTVLFSK